MGCDGMSLNLKSAQKWPRECGITVRGFWKNPAGVVQGVFAFDTKHVDCSLSAGNPKLTRPLSNTRITMKLFFFKKLKKVNHQSFWILSYRYVIS